MWERENSQDIMDQQKSRSSVLFMPSEG
ncbi:hypothetical protein M8C21_028643 [Ambrosia artemisiifolia]|uniref:Uncharacterized protein n=1 Tax=Ambrosia artemisiifolia TaxID=4212 RepID=A0AAD5GB96_AMBAR|nr:hypothetical protein M8C21_028643 [Ambrosia artemisiifolia]